MKKMSIIIFLLSIFIYPSCGNSGGDQQPSDLNIYNFFYKYHSFELEEYEGILLVIPRSGCRYCYEYALEALNNEKIREDIVILIVDHPPDSIKTEKYNPIFYSTMRQALSYRVQAFTLSIYNFEGDGKETIVPTIEEFEQVFKSLVMIK